MDSFFPKLEPAPLGARIAAGAIDLTFVGFLIGLLFLMPMSKSGLGLPMVVVGAVVIGYLVVPIAAFRTTLGMKLLGLELIGTNGHPADPLEVFVRELIGRGVFPVAYLTVAFWAVISMFIGGAVVQFPSGLALVLLLLCLVLFGISILGHLLILTRPDRRSLADLMARTIVVPRQPAKTFDDEEDRAYWLAGHRSKIRKVVVFELILVALTFGLPMLLTQRVSTGNQSLIARKKLEKLELEFRQDPTNARAAISYARELRAGKDAEGAKRVMAEHEAALDSREKERESSLRARVAKNPNDSQGVGLLVELLTDQDRNEEAREVYQAFFEADPVNRRAGYGVWLFQHRFYEPALEQLKVSVGEEPEDGELRAYLGLAYLRLGKKPEARAELVQASALDPDLDVAEELAELEAELGPMPAKGRARPKRK
jgi:uncharacterized RDD family membrane protein YckC